MVRIWSLALAFALSLSACDAPETEAERHAAAPPAPRPEGIDAKVAGTDFHATGSVPCSRREDQPMTDCKAGVVRNTDGSAVVTVFWPAGGSRVIFFGPNQTVVGVDGKQVEGSPELETRRAGDLTHVTWGAERYEIVDALPYGG